MARKRVVTVRADDFRAGSHWAFREGKALGTPASMVRLLLWVPSKPPSRRSARVKVQYLDGDLAGMEVFALPAQLVCPWKDWPRLLKWEQAEIALQQSLGDADFDKALVAAANAAFAASGEDIFLEDFRGYDRYLDVPALERVAKRAGWPPERTPWYEKPNFVRDGSRAYVAHHHLIQLAHDFAAQNAELVTLYVDHQEAEVRDKGFHVDRHYHALLLEQGPGHSIARDWAGATARTHLTEDVRHLRALVYEALNALRKAGASREADAIERKLNRYA